MSKTGEMRNSRGGATVSSADLKQADRPSVKRPWKTPLIIVAAYAADGADKTFVNGVDVHINTGLQASENGGS